MPEPPKKPLSVDQIISHIRNLKNANGETGSLQDYNVRNLVDQAKHIGQHLKDYDLKTSQIRKFLDAVKRLKAKLNAGENFDSIKEGIILLEPHLAYAAARKRSEMKKDEKINPAKDLSEIITAAIKQVHCKEDFARLGQFIEAIVAYHKEAGGKEL
jgi:CRISPR-associated protein Csm2